jgi:hypothetical protein
MKLCNVDDDPTPMFDVHGFLRFEVLFLLLCSAASFF